MDKNKRYKWYKVAEDKSDFNFPESGLLEIEVGGKQVCIARLNDNLYACASKCPHAGGTIAGGHIDRVNNIVVCPLHRYKFNIQNGRNVSGEGYYLKTYPVDQRDNGIYIGMEVSSFLGLL